MVFSTLSFRFTPGIDMSSNTFVFLIFMMLYHFLFFFGFKARFIARFCLRESFSSMPSGKVCCGTSISPKRVSGLVFTFIILNYFLVLFEKITCLTIGLYFHIVTFISSNFHTVVNTPSATHTIATIFTVLTCFCVCIQCFHVFLVLNPSPEGEGVETIYSSTSLNAPSCNV